MTILIDPSISSDSSSANHLRQFASKVYKTLGLPSIDADLLADTLVQADLWGHPSHGILRTFWYGARFKTQATKPVTKLEMVMDAGALALVDGHDGVGQVITNYAIQQAIDKAKQHGIGAISVRNSGHFGTAMYFTRLAAEQGCIGLLTSNASPAMSAWAGRQKLVGTNPWSFSAPIGPNHPPLVMDIANTTVARGKLYVAKEKGQPIPPFWALDAEGRPTIDAVEGIAGVILPMAGHKGYAIAVCMDVLSGILSGSAFGTHVNGPYIPDKPSGVGHFVLAIDIEKCRPLRDFESDMQELIASLKNSPKAVGHTGVFYPGELEARSEERLKKEGILLPEETVRALNEGAKKIGLERLG